MVGGSVATNVSRQVAPGEPLLVQALPPPFVSRAGGKLDPALDRFGIAVGGRHALDAGSSTGGFTDCLLQRGAAAGPGRGRGHEPAPRAVARRPTRRASRERTDIRAVQRGDLDPRTDLVVADLSFISVRGLLAHLLGLRRRRR